MSEPKPLTAEEIANLWSRAIVYGVEHQEPEVQVFARWLLASRDREIAALNQETAKLNVNIEGLRTAKNESCAEVFVLRKEIARLKDANEHWHLRVGQLKADMERLTEALGQMDGLCNYWEAEYYKLQHGAELQRTSAVHAAIRECAKLVARYTISHTQQTQYSGDVTSVYSADDALLRAHPEAFEGDGK